MIILANKENVFLKFFIEEQPIKKMLPKKFMHHHNAMTTTTPQCNQQKLIRRK